MMIKMRMRACVDMGWLLGRYRHGTDEAEHKGWNPRPTPFSTTRAGRPGDRPKVARSTVGASKSFGVPETPECRRG